MPKSQPTRVVALVGNPNCGKTALFNALTQSDEKVGNWPGVTVERKTGLFSYQRSLVQVVDLPGIYSTCVVDAGAIDAQITCEYLLSGEADIIVNVLDGSNLVRHLYLTLQLLEMGLPVVLAVNMLDVVRQQGLSLDLALLSRLTGCPVLGLVASVGEGVAALQQQLATLSLQAPSSPATLALPPAVTQPWQQLTQTIQHEMPSHASRARWLALRLLEGDRYASAQVSAEVLQQAELALQHVQTAASEDADILIADARYTLAGQWSDQLVRFVKPQRTSMTERIDRIVLNRFLGIPVFLGIMYLLFLFSINVGGALQDFFDLTSAALCVDGLTAVLQALHCPAWLTAIMANGLGRGINTVLTFTPVIGAMFLCLAVLEDCGYMARAAFVMDRLMQALGLPGRSFVPMIVGFGCNVPAVLAARTLAQRRDRILTVMMMPFMSCGARLAIFSVFASAFFPQTGALLIFSLYLFGVLIAVLSGLALRHSLLPGKPAPLVMELPLYHLPRWRSMLRQTWARLKGFVWRAGQFIVPICVVIGVMNAVNLQGQMLREGDAGSVLAHVGRAVTPVLAPMGITQDNWPATVGLMTGVLAKEVVIGSLNTLYNEAPTQAVVAVDVAEQLKQAVLTVPENLAALGAAVSNPIVASEPLHTMAPHAYGAMVARFGGVAAALAYLIFVLLYFPCVSTLAAMRREIGSAWAYGSLAWSTGLAYVLAVMSYQALTLPQHPWQSAAWLLLGVSSLAVAVLGLRYLAFGRAARLTAPVHTEGGSSCC